jgi:hypothetical protein
VTRGVYVMAKDGRPIYVGTSANIERRITQHPGDWFDSVWFQDVGEFDRFSLERTLIRRLRPCRNKAHNPTFYPPGTVYPVRIDRSVLAQLRSAAAASGLKIQAAVRQAIGAYLDRRNA